MTTKTKLAVRLPRENLDFLTRFPAAHGLTATEVLDRHLTRLRERREARPLHPEVERISALGPADVEAEALYRANRVEKHR